MTAALSHPLVGSATSVDWILDRVTEARGILADTTRHPDSLVILAARIVAGQTDDAGECAEAIDLLRLLDRRPLYAVAAAAFPKGGAA
ncbi:hypothetical protein [Rhodobacter ferrooxidans]|uniref:Uncharacterized protein n=1 Tax=Rhodobacter ferrooxidans TaxID=371731 RepID=C8S3N5_9RHOB|nr:hypothetical protein [Rhodobacter sp. SW2]EEW24367.1 hypothetical protein Rsw2DRAFT_2663 [Rhodobacter sp. SW2]